ncbi:cytochrome c oxidase subunit II [Rhizobium sp. AG855]|uniref:cytochrome c oxidase subunit II n=1 Tax=Rhizobium sp. AG855 TaxID=2183898 RepID=UPI000E7367C7|nr:cytochrome c oxidase subunit II [Rhizobium sp. AG855]RKE77568.1 cytochrome c oxidase subunit 2 [Rhizobium sp. AG855]
MIALATPLILGSCSGDLSALDPAGPYADAIANLWWVMLVGAGLIFALVISLFLLVLYRPGFGSALSARRWMIFGGLILPVPVLLTLIVYGLAKGEYLLGAWQNEPVIARVEAQARMWKWEFAYPDMDLSDDATGVLHIPVGGVVEVSVTSTDVIHSFWIPRLAGKIDAIPGHTTRLRIKADAPGRYGGICAEYCGTGHSAMRFVVEAHPPEIYRQRLTELTTAKADR